MLKSVKRLLIEQNQEIESLKKELKETKQKLQYRHTEINDLRFIKKQMARIISQLEKEKKARINLKD